jgi:asparagine synthase (glutamine-hydrolysing)
MCGITGLRYFDDDRPVRRQEIAAMCAVLRHRGPDDEGIYLDGSFGMGIRRLAVIDLLTGHAPLSNEDGSVWVVQNGEIYNFPELRGQLERRGHRFRSSCDTEVIAHLYEEEGPACVRSLRGMYALALWDEKHKTLLLARDRLGIKPLYYACDGKRLLFGSELKPLLTAGLEPRLDLQALHDYLSLSYVPAPSAIFRGVRKLPPGHLLLCQDGQVRVERYWQVSQPSAGPWDGDETALTDELYGLLCDAVRSHLTSDVPLGVFLSGGMDSSAVVALMREVSGGPIKTFSVGFPEKSFNELEQARLVARRFATDHHELIVTAKAAEIVPQLAHYFDEPFGDSSALPVYYLSRFARQSITVALSGDGGDEVFAGYETYAAYRWAEAYKRLPRLLGERIVPAVVRRLPVSHKRLSLDYKAKRFVEGALLPPDLGHFTWKRIFSEEAKRQLYREGRDSLQATARIYRDHFASCGTEAVLDRLLRVDLSVGLPDDMLVKVDRMSMAHSLEVRVPLLDHPVVEFMAALPHTVKMRGWRKKYLLKKAMAGKLPDHILHGKKKGFNVPIPSWLLQDLRELVHDTLAPGRLRESGLWDPAVVASMIREHEERRRDWSRNIWCLLIFQLWYDTYMNGRSARGFMAAAHDSSGV